MSIRQTLVLVVILLLTSVGCDEQKQAAPAAAPLPTKLALETVRGNSEVLPMLNEKLVSLEGVSVVYVQKLVRKHVWSDGISTYSNTSTYDLYEIRDSEEKLLFHAFCSAEKGNPLDGVKEVSGELCLGSSLHFDNEHPQFSEWVLRDIAATKPVEAVPAAVAEKSSEREAEILERLRKLEAENSALQKEIKAIRTPEVKGQ